MKKIGLVVAGLVVVIGTGLLIGRERAQKSQEEGGTTEYTEYAVRQSRNQILEPLNPLNSFTQRMNKIYE